VTLNLILDMAADGFGDRLVIGPRATGLTARELQLRSIAGAEKIRASGADSVVYLGVNGPAFPVALFAAARAGVPLVPLNYRLGSEQLEAVLARHKRGFGIADSAQIALLERAGITSRSKDHWMDACASEIAAEGSRIVDPSQPAVLIYTSGTTAAPKAVVLRHENLFSYVVGSVEFASADASEAALVSVPPYHIAAVANTITNLYAGRRTIVLEQFTSEEWVSLARDEDITNALVVPTMLARLMELPDDQLKLPALKALAYGGASMPARVIEKALRRWPEVNFVNAYGLTETSSTVCVLGPQEHRDALESDDGLVRARLSSAGRPVPGIELEIRDEVGNPLSTGVVGRIWVRGDQVADEYAGVGSITDATGFFDTRDAGYLDEGGYLFIGGRVDDTIIRGSENIAPAEIEEVLLNHEDVDDAVVVGVPDEEWGQRIEAAVVLRSNAPVDGNTLRDHLRDRLRSSKTPDHIHVWSSLPRTETGKLVRRLALQQILDNAEAPDHRPTESNPV
jgi:acyl-CoA synthetase (AMP-forming)/AMP-acid ligase II